MINFDYHVITKKFFSRKNEEIEIEWRKSIVLIKYINLQYVRDFVLNFVQEKIAEQSKIGNKENKNDEFIP